MKRSRSTGGIAARSAVTAVIALSFVAPFACIDPKGDYEEYVDRTDGRRGSQIEDVGVIEVGDADPNADFSGNFLMSCLPLAFRDTPNWSFLFYAEMTVTGGALSATITQVKETATTFSKSETVGNAQVATGVPIADGKWTVDIGAVEVPGDSQRIGTSLIKLANVVYQGRTLSKDRLCAEMQGAAIEPLTQEFNDPGDYCIFVRLDEGAPLPKATLPDGTEYIGFSKEEHICPAG